MRRIQFDFSNRQSFIFGGEIVYLLCECAQVYKTYVKYLCSVFKMRLAATAQLDYLQGRVREQTYRPQAYYSIHLFLGLPLLFL